MNPEQQLKLALMALLVMALLGFALIGAYFLTARTRSYLLYLGLAFITLGVLSISKGLVFQLVVVAIFLAFFITAAKIAIQDTRERLQVMRKQQADRESAFAEFLQASVEHEVEQEAETAKPASEE